MKKFLLIFAVVLVLVVMFSCTQISEILSSNAKVSVVLTSGTEGEGDTIKPQEYSDVSILGFFGKEAPWVKDIQKLEIKVSKFSYKYSTGPSEGKWATPTSVDQVIDLVSLASTDVSWLTFDIPKGAVIVALAFEITEATVTINGQDYSVTIPSGEAKIVLKNMNWTINENSEIALSIDWTRSIINIAPGSYILVPRIAYRWRGALKDLWAIEGSITHNNTAPTEPLLIGLYEGTDTTAKPLVLKMIPIEKEGDFYLGKHKPGQYTVVVWNNLTFTYDGTDVTFNAAEATRTTFEHGKTNATTRLSLTY